MFTIYWRFFSIAGIMSLSLPIAPAPIPTASSPESLRKSNPPHLDVNEGGVSFFPVSERNQDETRPQLGNGSVANTREWPASFIAKSGSATCTATLIGPRTLLTAAHCVGDGATATVSYLNTPIISGICRRPTSWSVVEPSNDWALCLMEKEIIRNGLAYEAISLDASAVISGLRLTVGGYGCTDLANQAIETPPIFRIGSVFVDRVAIANQPFPNWIFTTAAAQGSAAFLCPGDSGGAVYKLRADQSRVVVAVASAIGADPSGRDYKVSYLAALGTSAGAEFVRGWLKDNQQRICGLMPVPDNCRPVPN